MVAGEAAHGHSNTTEALGHQQVTTQACHAGLEWWSGCRPRPSGQAALFAHSAHSSVLNMLDFCSRMCGVPVRPAVFRGL